MSTVVIRVGGTDVTENVVFASTEFGSQVNGQPGPARLKVRDLDHIYSFRAGNTLTLDVDGDRLWGGWAMRVQQGYFFPADSTEDADATERVWELEGVDYNILFSKRFLINKATPTKMIPNYPAGTPDDEVILDIVANFLELSGDGISTTGVTHVGTPNEDQPGNVGNPGDSWGACMNLITRPTGSIFYIDPLKVLHHVDVDTADAPFALSDQPNGTSSFGYRDMEIFRNGSKLINDVMVWGAGTGSTNGVTFHRVEDAASIAAHGRWQAGEFTTALYTQQGINNRANSIVYGSPQNKRGAKDDAITVTCTVYEPGLKAGQKISFTSEIFDYVDVLPIRRMVIKFPTPTDVEYLLNLSHEVDAPWADFEFWFPKFNFDFNIPPIDIGDISVDPPDIVPTEDCEWTMFDDFSNRTIARGSFTTWGNASSGPAYEVLAPWLYVNGGTGIMEQGPFEPPDGDPFSFTAANIRPIPDVIRGSLRRGMKFKFKANRVTPDGSAANELRITFRNPPATATCTVYLFVSEQVGFSHIEVTSLGGIGASGFTDDLDWDADTWYWVRIDQDPSTIRVKRWLESEEEPGSWDLEADGNFPLMDGDILMQLFPDQLVEDPGGNILFYFDDIQFEACTGNCNNALLIDADEFDRTVTLGETWGTSEFDGSPPWEDRQLPLITNTASVSGGVARMVSTNSFPNAQTDQAISQFNMRFPVDVVVKFQLHAIPGANPQILISFTDSTLDYSVSLSVHTLASSSGDIAVGGSDPINDYEDFKDGSIDGDKWYIMRASFLENVAKIRAWEEGEEEPSAWDAAVGINPLIISNLDLDNELRVTIAGSNMGNGSYGYIEYIRFYEPCSSSTNSFLTGASCESFDGGGAEFALSRGYLPLTTRVYIDGLLQRRGVEYTETSPALGTVTFGETTPEGSAVTICSTADTAGRGRGNLLL